MASSTPTSHQDRGSAATLFYVPILRPPRKPHREFGA
jgi:hypothetical protein